MAATFYWFAWLITIIVFFFIHQKHLRQRLLLFIGIVMCTYSMGDGSIETQFYLHVSLLIIMGIIFWIRPHRRFFQHFWPFVISLGYTSVQLFLIVNPVWLIFPAIQLSIVLVLYLLQKIVSDMESLIGLWLLVNGGGTLWSYAVFSIFGNEGLIDSEGMLVYVLKGIVIILVMNGIEILKKSIHQKKKTKKGAAYV